LDRQAREKEVEAADGAEQEARTASPSRWSFRRALAATITPAEWAKAEGARTWRRFPSHSQGAFDSIGLELPRIDKDDVMLSTPRAPVSWGELIDKITILEIKADEIDDPAAVANVREELRLLREIEGEAHATAGQLAELKTALKSVNLALWRIEDAIRDKERAKIFDGAFIELARSVYQRNDERARIKRRINEVTGSHIVEQKSYAAY
jgi:hypothetical protein